MDPAAEPLGTGAYPASWEADVVVRDGHTVRIRPIVPGDADRLLRFHRRQSPESIYFRYFSPRPRLSETDVRHLTVVDHRDRVAFVALSEDEMIGVARYERYRGTDTAEVAFFVDDDHQGRGLATLLLEYLVEAGRDNGVRRFTATTLPNNRRMLRVFTAAGYDVATRLDEGVIEVSFDIAPTVEAFAAIERRERVAEAASVRRLLHPRSVAVVGAARSEGGLGREVLRNLVGYGFAGEVYAVNREATAGDPIEGLEVHRTVSELPEAVDLVLVAVPAAEVPGVVDECGRVGVGGVAVLSAGFSEDGEKGLELELRTVEAARRHGIRLLGPNCLGMVNTDPQVRLDATIVPVPPRRGRVGMLAESGLLSASILDHAVQRELGMSTFVAAGNRADVAATDLLSYWLDDDATHAVLMYLAARSLPPRFVRAARAASLAMPVAALHTALSGVVHRGSSARRTARDAERRAHAVFRQTGVISVSTLGQLVDLGRVLADQPVPAGRGVAIVGNSSGAVALAADGCRSAGLELVAVEVEGPDGRRRANPIDLTFRAGAEDYERALADITRDPAVHSVLVMHTPPHLDVDDDVVQALLRSAARAPEVTFVVTLLGAHPARLEGEEGVAIPVFRFPEDALHAVGRLAAYRSWHRAADRAGSEGPSGCDPAAGRQIVALALAQRAGESASETEAVQLTHAEQEQLLDAYRVDVVPRRVVADASEAVGAGEDLGWPVALKAKARNRRARATASGVTLDIADPEQMLVTWARMEEVLAEGMSPAVVQRFVADGIDVSIRVERHPDGAGTVEVGLGGPAAISGAAELGVLPLSLGDASALVASSPVGGVLSDPMDRVRIVELVHRLAALADDLEAVRCIHADPVLVSGAGAEIADVEITVADAPEEFSVRRLE